MERDTANEPAVERAVTAAPAAHGAAFGLETPESILRLQRSIGNRGVGRMLTSRTMLSRQTAPMPIGSTEVVQAPSGILTPEQKVKLANAAAARVNQAFTAFTAAVARYQKKLESEAKAEAEIVAATVDIFFGLYAPIFAVGRLAGAGGAAALAKRVAAATSVDVEGKAMPMLSNTDFLKETFKGVGKIGTTAIKLNATTLFGETEADAFASALRTQFHHGIQALTDKLTLEPDKLTDEQVIATFLAYHADFTDENAYVDVLKGMFAGFEKWVKPIGEQGGGTQYSGGSEVQAVWLDAYGRKRLAIVYDTYFPQGFTGGGFPRFQRGFVGWVPKDMEQFVVAKTVRNKGMVTEADPGTITGHIPEPVD